MNFNLASILAQATWVAFRNKIGIYRLYGDGCSGASAALLKYEPGAELPPHRHVGYEHILVISGSQSDEYGQYDAGTLIVNQPGSEHTVRSERGCEVLVTWASPVVFLDPFEPQRTP